jgi:hypothetical protein
MIMIEHSRSIAVALVLTAVAAFAAPAAAQELSFGYQVQRFSAEGDGVTAPFGASFSIAGPGSGPVSVVGQVDWSLKRMSETIFGTSVDATANFAAFAGGVRWSGRAGRGATPFVETLFGAMRTSGSAHIAGAKIGSGSETDPMFQVGGGVSVPMGGALGAFGQVDYRRIFADETGANGLRFVAGVRLMAR